MSKDTLAATASIWSRLPNEEQPTTRGRLSPSSRSTDSHSSASNTLANGLKPPHSLAPHPHQPAHSVSRPLSHTHASEFVPSPRSSVSSSSFSATPESSNSPRDRLAGSKGLAPPPPASHSATRFSSPKFASSLGLYQDQAPGAASEYAPLGTNGQAATAAAPTSRGPTGPPPASNQPLLAEIFSGNPRPHYRPSLSTSALSPHQRIPSHSTASPRSDSGATLLTSPPIVPEGRSYFAPPPPDSAHGRARSHSIAGIEKPAVPMNLRGGPPPSAGGGAADQHGFRHSSTLTSGGGGGHFSASFPTTSAVGSPTYAHSAFSPGPPPAASNRDLSASPSRPSYSPFDSSNAGWKPSGNSGFSHSFSAGWNDEVGSSAAGGAAAREGRSRFRDQWASPATAGGTALSTSASSSIGGGGAGGGIGMSNMSPFSRDGARLLPDLPSPFGGPGSSSLTSGEWSGLGGSAAYKSRRDYALGAVGSGRKRSDSAWARSALQEAEEDLEGGDELLQPPTKSGATSRRHSFAAFEPPSRGSTMQLGFHLPEEPSAISGGRFGPLATPAPSSNGWGGRGLGSSAINDDDLAADLNSLHLNLEAHAAATQDERKTRFAHVGSMPADFPPARSSRVLEQSRSPPPPPASSVQQPAVSSATAVGSQPMAAVSLPAPVPSSSSTLSTTTATPTPHGQSTTSPRPPGDSSNPSTSALAASRFFQGLPAPTPLPPATTTATATATASPGLGGSSRFGFDQQQQQQQRGAQFGRLGGLPPPVPPPATLHPFFAPATTTGPLSPRASTAFPPVPPPPFPGFGSGVSPAIPPPHMPGQHYQQHQQQPIPPPASYFSAPPPPPPPVPAQQPGAPPLTAQAQGDINLGRGVPLHAIPPDAPLCIVGFKAGRKDLFFCEDPNVHLEEGDLVIVEADRGRDVGKYLKSCTIEEVHKFQQHLVELALGQLANPSAQGAQGGMMGQMQGMGGAMGGGAQGGGAGGAAGPAQLARMTKECQPKRIYGKAGPADTHALLAKAQDEVKALALVRSKVAQKGLPMEILDAEWQWDRRKLTFYYTADQRVDFRELVRELFRIWKTRVWLCCLDQQQPSFDLV
ncbi:PSP1 family protein [Rhodotorula toruloides]|uniref:PSP1 family protein n=1 Tax=Rhodotorula toruloides TaxID=5286 RepID=A0A511KJC4_RHOTO|nr:PSP1 family protein [Rhodotorula toruloides]